MNKRATPYQQAIKRPAMHALFGASVLGGLVLACMLLATMPSTTAAQGFGDLGPGLPRAVNEQEIRRIIEVARESGFSEEQVAEITIEDENGNVVHALEYLLRIERERAERLAREEALRNKRYLTVQDVFSELRESESRDLDQLRKQYILTQ